MEINIFDKHQTAIAKKTLRMSDAGAAIMGGMTKEQARTFLTRIGYTAKQIEMLEISR